MGILGILLFLFGIHFLYFKELWINDFITFNEKNLQGKPGWYQKWLSIHKSEKHNTFMVPLGGIFFVILGLIIILSKVFGITL